jgi:hypothetical protein
MVWGVFLVGLFFFAKYIFYIATRLLAEMACAGVKKRNIFDPAKTELRHRKI